jgi:hypothetical protein
VSMAEGGKVWVQEGQYAALTAGGEAMTYPVVMVKSTMTGRRRTNLWLAIECFGVMLSLSKICTYIYTLRNIKIYININFKAWSKYTWSEYPLKKN